MEMTKRKSKAEEKDFYKDFIYPAPGEKQSAAQKSRTGRGKAAGGTGRKYAVVILIIFALTAALLLADYLSNGLAFGLFKKSASDNVVIKAAEYYAVETGAFTSLNQAKACANQTAAAGGAGCIYNDGTFRIFASVHQKQADAASALAAYPNADIYVLKIAGANIEYTGGRPEKDTVREAFLTPSVIFAEMVNLSGKLKSASISPAQGYIAIQGLENDARNALDKLSAAMAGDTAMPLIRIKAELTSIINILEGLADLNASAADLTRDINYNAVKVLCSYKDMMNEMQ